MAIEEVKKLMIVGFDKDVAVFYPEDWKLAKTLLETIYNAKIVYASDGKTEKLKEAV